jgi:hypothetical protein
MAFNLSFSTLSRSSFAERRDLVFGRVDLACFAFILQISFPEWEKQR